LPLRDHAFGTVPAQRQFKSMLLLIVGYAPMIPFVRCRQRI
jgi:hypothetical protein